MNGHNGSAEKAFPEPTLTYHFWGTRRAMDLEVVTSDPIHLYSLNQVLVSRERDGSMYAYLRGKMRKRNGEPSRHSRSVLVTPHPSQPLWLILLFADAGRRLGVRVSPTQEAGRG